MSSSQVRTAIKDLLDDESAENVVDITGHFEDFKVLLQDEGIQPNAPWLGLEFIGDDEIPISLSATNELGLYRETGLIVLHVAAEAKIGVGDSLVQRGEVLRNLFRGRRIGNIVIESVTPINTSRGATLEFDGGYMSGTINMAYYCDIIP